jgi:hypothetical protein
MPGHEQATQAKPLHGDWVYSTRIVPLDGKQPTLIRRRHAMEWAYTDRVNAQIHPDYPGIHVAKLFYTPMWYSGGEPIPLEEAENFCTDPQKFQLSMAASNLAILTSQIGYQETRNVRVLPPSEYLKWIGRDLGIDVKMRDYEKEISGDELTKRHIGRVARAGGDVCVQLLPQSEMDEVFRHIVQDRTDEFNAY